MFAPTIANGYLNEFQSYLHLIQNSIFTFLSKVVLDTWLSYATCGTLGFTLTD